MTVHEIAGRVEMSGRDIVNLQEDRVSALHRARALCRSAAWLHPHIYLMRCRPPPSPLSLQDRLKQVIQTQDDILNARILSECTACREDANHKFALQVAENKRLQAQLAKAQADVQRLTRIVENLTTRMSMVETNCGFQ